MIRIISTLIISFLLLLTFTPEVKAQVVINEFLPNASQEWVEFYNSGAATEDLSNYYFDDDTDFNSDSGSSAKVALSGLLPTLSTCYLDLNTFLNNNGDTPTIFKIDQTQVDSYHYTTTVVDKSFSRVPDGGTWQIEQTPSKSAVRCSDSAPTPVPTPDPTQAPTNPPTSAPTASPTTTPTKTSTPVPTKSPTSKPSETPTPEETTTPEVLGENIEITPSPSALVEGNEVKKNLPLLPIIFIGSGVLMIGFAVYNLVRAKKNIPLS